MVCLLREQLEATTFHERYPVFHGLFVEMPITSLPRPGSAHDDEVAVPDQRIDKGLRLFRADVFGDFERPDQIEAALQIEWILKVVLQDAIPRG